MKSADLWVRRGLCAMTDTGHVTSEHAKKTGRKINSPPGLNLGCDSESIRNRDQAVGLNASFSSLIFSLLLFSLASTIPPFQIRVGGDA
jgi:hypothetical protein